MRVTLSRLLALLGAVLGWFGVVLQLALTLGLIHDQGGSLPDGLWRYLGYFTVIANIFAVFVLTLAALRQATPGRDFAAATAMILVGITYSLLLRETWNPQGPQKLADIILHDLMPVIMASYWLARPHGALRWKHLGFCLVLPLAYCGYALARGAMDGWYPYPFLDLAQLGAARLALNCLGLAAGFLLMALFLLGLDRLLPAQPRPT